MSATSTRSTAQVAMLHVIDPTAFITTRICNELPHVYRLTVVGVAGVEFGEGR